MTLLHTVTSGNSRSLCEDALEERVRQGQLFGGRVVGMVLEVVPRTGTAYVDLIANIRLQGNPVPVLVARVLYRPLNRVAVGLLPGVADRDASSGAPVVVDRIP